MYTRERVKLVFFSIYSFITEAGVSLEVALPQARNGGLHLDLEVLQSEVVEPWGA